MQHFFLPQELLTAQKFTLSDPAVLHQMNRVLRMRAGDTFIALDDRGFEYVCTLDAISPVDASATIIEKRKNTTEPEMQVTLYQSLPKKMELFEWVLQKGTEIGVSAFVPLITERTERLDITKRERLLKILKEAAEQSERGHVPLLAQQQKFAEAVMRGKEKDERTFLLHGRGDYPLFSHVLGEQRAKRMNILIGPEGGFTEKEIAAAEQNNVIIATLGKLVLRTETAGIAAAALALANNS